jgi:pyridoxine 5'-phosphate synthase PdxJ
VLPQDYRDLLEVAEDAGRPLRAAQIAAAAGLSVTAGHPLTVKVPRTSAQDGLDGS